ncbi:Clp protease ClpP [Kaustia mangrovi]|uniref:ATP-dependent Clp protease proteolytic subunit n=1 Tax=Kaustia mangrovi TaxID=2593653 RepID=A0A7S8C4Z2_9HYPH|nr:head maturation protease, ClpP-related [Kaustia mangrovi]QPC43496.1 Clp protease ClpP [Kaustia mangrovi]
MSLRKLPEIQAFQKPDWLNFEAPEQTVEAFDPAVTSAVDGDDTTISIYGQIGIDPVSSADNTERRIGAALRSIGKRDVTVNLNSPGGNFFSGIAIYNQLRAHPARVSVQIIGMAGSAASVIAMAGDDILMSNASFVMVHNASGIVIGNKFDAQDAAELLAQVDDAMADVYAARSGADKETVTGWMDRHRGDGTMFNASSAIETGLADGRLDPGAVKVRADTRKSVPCERVIENALVSSANMTPQEAKTLVAEFKAGTRDAPVATLTRDADEFRAAAPSLFKL